MASRGARLRTRVQRLPLGLFGFNREDVLEMVTQIEAERRGAEEAFAAAAADQQARIVRTLARRATLQDQLERLRSDREHLARQLEQARRNASTLEEGVRGEVARLEAAHAQERVRLEGFLPEVDKAIGRAEGELKRLADGLERLLRGVVPEEDQADATEFADVTAALLARPPEDMPLTRLQGGRSLFELPRQSVRLQVRGRPQLGAVTGIVVSVPPPRVLGFAVDTESGSGVIPTADVVALRQGTVLVRDAYRLVDVAALPEEATRVIFPVSRPSRPQGQELDVTESAPAPPAQTGTRAEDEVAAGSSLVGPESPAGATPVSIRPEDPREERGAVPEPAPGVLQPSAGEGGDAAQVSLAQDAPGGEPRDRDDRLETVPPRMAVPTGEESEPAAQADAGPAQGDGTEAAVGRSERVAFEHGDVPEAEPSLRPGAGEAVAGPVQAAVPRASATGDSLPPTRGTAQPGDVAPVLQGEGPAATPQAAPPSSSARRQPAPAPAASGARGAGEVAAPEAERPRPKSEPNWPAGVPLPAWQLPPDLDDLPRESPGALPPAVPQLPPQQTPAQGQPPTEPRVPVGGAGLNILAFIAGKVVGRDLVSADGRLVAARGTRITPELVAEVEMAGLLPEMIVYMTLPGDGR